jgi:hypothetical protein
MRIAFAALLDADENAVDSYVFSVINLTNNHLHKTDIQYFLNSFPLEREPPESKHYHKHEASSAVHLGIVRTRSFLKVSLYFFLSL